MLVFVVYLFGVVSHVLATTAWTQTDWSGGVGSSTANQYSSATSVDSSTAGDLSLTKSSGWFNGAWKYRKKITFNNTTANLGVTAENLTNFTVLVKLNSGNFDFSKAQSNGQDIRFTDSDGTTALGYQIEKWDSANSQALVWVKVPQVDNTNTDYIYGYYGNSVALDGQAASGTWDSGYQGVWHLQESSGQHQDSTANGNNSNTVIVATQGTATGQIGGADTFNGTSNTVNIPNSSSLSSPTTGLTLDAWISVSNCNTSNAFIHKEMNYTLALYDRNTGGCQLTYADSSVWSYDSFGYYGNIAKDGAWHHVVATKSGATVNLYLDNALLVSKSFGGAIVGNTNLVSLGSYTGSNYFSGSLDEVRISNTARTAGFVAAEYKVDTGAFNSFGTEEARYTGSGTLTSAIFDGTIPNDWGQLTYNAIVPSGTSVSVKVRSGNNPDLSDASAFSSCSAVTSGSDVTSACAPDQKRYAQYQVTFSGGGADTPVLQDISIVYSASDIITPPTNASALLMYKSNGGASVSSNGWTNTSPYFAWTAGADDAGGSGIKGYCLYVGTDSTADPVTTKGLLGTSPINTGGACQFAVSSNSIDLSTAGYLGTALSTSNSSYYINVKAIDNANNVFSGPSASFQFRYDNTPPANPSFITAPSNFVANKAVSLTWPTSGSDAAVDSNSGLAGLQYRIGSSGTWYGDSHTGSQDATDLLANDGGYTTQSNPDFANLNEGNNIVYFRTWDAAGNPSPAFVTTVIKLNTTSPSSPQNVDAAPNTNTTNSFAFSWLKPASFTGSASNITYCYTVNVTPTSSNCTFTAGGVTSLPAGAYATQPGDNTFYVVAKDEAGNINYATAASTVFTANTAAPGVPLSPDIADISVKATSSWKLAVSWEAPSQVGAGVASYKVYRSTDNSNFFQIASTSGSSYVDSGLSQVTYYYKVKACDSANNCGALTTAVSKKPTGKFTSPAALLSKPSVSNLSTRKATISWVTERTSDSKVATGTKSGTYSSDETSNSDQTTVHTINLNNLNPGTTYYLQAKWTDEDGNTGTAPETSFTTLPAPSISGVKIVNPGLSTATLQFTSKAATSVKIYYGKSKSYGAIKLVNTSVSESSYSVALDGLDDGTEYFYKLNPFDSDGNEYDSAQVNSFTTPARPKISNLRFQPVKDEPTSTQQVSWTTNVPASSELSYGPDGQMPQSALDSKLVTEHQMVIKGLLDNTIYSLTALSRDNAGNLASSDRQIFKTALDTRPPKITGVKVSASIKGTGGDAHGQVIVSWKTDEPATSQVAYGEGSSSDSYSTSTAEDAALVTDHVVIVSNLPTSQIFHLKAISADGSKNKAGSDNYSTIIGNSSDNVLSIIFNALQKVFGL